MVRTHAVPRLVGALMAAAVLLAAHGVGAQPPVAKPQPPPKPPAEGTTATGTAPATAAPAPKPGSAQPAQAPPTTPAAGPATTPPGAKPVAPSPTPAAQPAATAAAPPRVTTQSVVAEAAPAEGSLGVPVLPNAVYLGSYDAGGAGQRFYLYGTSNRFADVVGYYRTVLRDRGELVFEFPATHMWEVGRFKDDQVAFPPGVTVKDYTFAGSPGLANPKPGSTPIAFPTVIQIVPPATMPIQRGR